MGDQRAHTGSISKWNRLGVETDWIIYNVKEGTACVYVCVCVRTCVRASGGLLDSLSKPASHPSPVSYGLVTLGRSLDFSEPQFPCL